MGIEMDFNSKQLAMVLAAKSGDQGAMAKLIKSLEPRATQLAMASGRRGQVPLKDLLQECAIAIIEAVRRFDPERGYLFSTYIDRRLFGAIRDYYRSQSPSGSRKKNSSARGRHRILSIHGLADGRSMDLECDHAPAEMESAVARLFLDDVLSQLQPPMADVIELRYRHGLNLDEIASRVGRCESAVSKRLLAFIAKQKSKASG